MAEQLSIWAPGRVRGVFIREERPAGDAMLRTLADDHASRVAAAIPGLRQTTLTVFDTTDLAVVGGRQAASMVADLPIREVTDVVVDISALSVGVSFPLVRALLEEADREPFNLHATVVADAVLDATIIPERAEIPSTIHGFRGELGLDSRADAAKLWLPQLAYGRSELLKLVHSELDPHDTCPILPFPAEHPRIGDELVEEYLPLLTDAWGVDTRNIIYAAEDDPLDVYRTILELDDARRPVFEGDGGSLCVLSPVGSKVLGLGVLMAATERDFSVQHVEAVGYKANAGDLRAYPGTRGTFAHVWLTGDPYLDAPQIGSIS